MDSKEMKVKALTKSNRKKIIGVVAAGVVIGTTLGMLMAAEKSGDGIKAKLKKKGKRLAGDLKQKMESVGDADDDDDID